MPVFQHTQHKDKSGKAFTVRGVHLSQSFIRLDALFESGVRIEGLLGLLKARDAKGDFYECDNNGRIFTSLEHAKTYAAAKLK